MEFVEMQEEHVKDEQTNLKRDLLREQEELKLIRSVPLVIAQFMEIVRGILGSTAGSSNYDDYEQFLRAPSTASCSSRRRRWPCTAASPRSPTCSLQRRPLSSRCSGRWSSSSSRNR